MARTVPAERQPPPATAVGRAGISLVSSHSRWLGRRVVLARLSPGRASLSGWPRERGRVVQAGKNRRRPSHRNGRADSSVRRRRRFGHFDAAARNGPSNWNETSPLDMPAEDGGGTGRSLGLVGSSVRLERSRCAEWRSELIRSTRRPGCIDVEGNEPTPLLVVHTYRR